MVIIMSEGNDIVLGIDLGTSNSVACTYIDGKPVFIPSSDGTNIYGPSFPSYVAFTDGGSVLVGEPAKRRYVSYPEDVVRAIKREMGEIVKKEYKGKLYSPQEISALILGKIKKDAEIFLKKPVKDVIITVPANFDDNQRTATKDAAKIAGLNVNDLINEPTAACLAYGVNNQSNGLQRILVFDLGGGTLDVTIMEHGAIFKVKSIKGDTNLGGNDMDNIISNFLIKEFEKQHGVRLNLNNKLKNRLMEAAERAKIDLSSVYETEVNLPFMGMDSNGNPLDLVTTITRPQLDDLVRPIVNRCGGTIQAALDGAGFTKNDIDKLILVGGPTRMPIVRKFVQNFIGLTAEESIDPMSCVAQGAALKGASYYENDDGEIESVPDFIDVIPLSLGIISKGRVTEVIVKADTEVPIKEKKKFRTVKDNQRTIKVEIVQGEFKMADKNTYLGSFLLNIEPAPKGRVKVEIIFEIDKSGILNVTAIDETTGNKKSLTLDSPNKMSEYEIRKAIKEYKLLAEQDETERILQGMKNDAYSVIDDAKNLIDKYDINYSDKNEIKTLIKSLEEAIDSNNPRGIKKKTVQLNKLILRL